MTTRKIDAIRKKILDAIQVPYDVALEDNKREELDNYRSKQSDKFYKDLIFDTKNDISAIASIEVELEFVETPTQQDLWDTFRARTSSIVGRRNIGRNIRILVKDKQTKTYLGIISLASDFADYQARDDFIGWTRRNRFQDEKLKYVLNINTCVGLQPISYNCNIGKLLVAICYSKEVHDYIHAKYGHDIACITTMSINGKSIQYDRMKPYLQLVGYTKGMGTIQISDALYNECVDLLKTINDVRSLRTVYTRTSRMDVLFKAFDILGINRNKLNHGQARGCYVGFVGHNAREFLCDKVSSFDHQHIKPLNEIVEWWKTRWAVPRFKHLQSTGKLQYKKVFLNYTALYNLEKQIKSVTKKKAELGDQQYHNIQSAYMREYRKRRQDEKDSHILKIQNTYLKELVPIDAQVLAGFIDGDGSLYATKVGLSLGVQQCNPSILLKLYKQFGGNIRSLIGRSAKSRNAFTWYMNGSSIKPFLEYIKDHVIIDEDKYKHALELLECTNKAQRTELSTKIRLLCKTGNQCKHYDRVNIKYIAGMFDAEGCVGFTLKSGNRIDRYVSITQKLDITLLSKIQEFFGFGKVDTFRYTVYGSSEIRKFIHSVLPFVTVKKHECELALAELDSQIKDDKVDLVKKIVDYKHRQHSLEDTIPLKIVNDEKNRAPKVIPEHQRKIIKERMTGAQNPNSNGMSLEHRQRISASRKERFLDKRKYSDEQILLVRKRFAEGNITQTQLALEENIDRRVVSSMISGKLQTSEEVKASLGVITKSKYDKKEHVRVWVPEDVIKVLIYLRDHPQTQLKVLEERSLELFQREIKLTTLRNWVYGKVGPKEAEFPILGITYEEYLNMIRTPILKSAAHAK